MIHSSYAIISVFTVRHYQLSYFIREQDWSKIKCEVSENPNAAYNLNVISLDRHLSFSLFWWTLSTFYSSTREKWKLEMYFLPGWLCMRHYVFPPKLLQQGEKSWRGAFGVTTLTEALSILSVQDVIFTALLHLALGMKVSQGRRVLRMLDCVCVCERSWVCVCENSLQCV